MRGLGSVTDNWPNPNLRLPEDTKTAFHDKANPKTDTALTRQMNFLIVYHFVTLQRRRRALTFPLAIQLHFLTHKQLPRWFLVFLKWRLAGDRLSVLQEGNILYVFTSEIIHVILYLFWH